MFSQRIRCVMERKKMLTAPPETTVSKAAKLMEKKNVGAVMVVEKERPGRDFYRARCRIPRHRARP